MKNNNPYKLVILTLTMAKNKGLIGEVDYAPGTLTPQHNKIELYEAI